MPEEVLVGLARAVANSQTFMQDFEKSFEGRRLPVPRKDMLAANTTEAFG